MSELAEPPEGIGDMLQADCRHCGVTIFRRKGGWTHVVAVRRLKSGSKRPVWRKADGEAVTTTIKGSQVRVGDCIQDPLGTRFLRISAIVRVPSMSGRMLWFEDIGRGDHRAVRDTDVLIRAD